MPQTEQGLSITDIIGSEAKVSSLPIPWLSHSHPTDGFYMINVLDIEDKGVFTNIRLELPLFDRKSEKGPLVIKLNLNKSDKGLENSVRIQQLSQQDLAMIPACEDLSQTLNWEMDKTMPPILFISYGQNKGILIKDTPEWCNKVYVYNFTTEKDLTSEVYDRGEPLGFTLNSIPGQFPLVTN